MSIEGRVRNIDRRPNLDRRLGEVSEEEGYIWAMREYEDGTLEEIAFTENEIKIAALRAEKNLSDLTEEQKSSILSWLFG